MSQIKDQSIETLRGIAIIFMVAGHVIGGDLISETPYEENPAYSYFYYSFKYLRMPLFATISGFVYAIRPAEKSKVASFLEGKLRRIFLPFVSASTISYLIRVFMPNINNPVNLSDIWKIYIFPYDHFWFLQSIILIFITIFILDANGMLKAPSRWLICLAGASIVMVFVPRFTEFFSFGGYIYLLPFFILGCGFNRFQNYIFKPAVILTTVIVFALGVTIQQLIWFDYFSLKFYSNNLLSLCIGISGTTLLFRFRKPFKPLAWIGFFSYAIYLFHGFGCALRNIVLRNLEVSNLEVLFISGLILGLFVPVLFEVISQRFFILRRLFLGLK
ncbi:MAG: acyltransferase [candidate division Zixibacteria bacterium]|nr:acyltransferase [candidate division Zixibacteria bacterium]